MSLAQVILCDRHGLWTAAAARQLGRGVRVRRTSSLAECDAELAAAPRAVVALAVTADNLPSVLHWLERQPRAWPLASPVCLLHDDLAEFEWLLREAGAAHVAVSPRGLQSFDVLVSNHVARLPVAAVRWADRVWESLPWGDAGAASKEPS